MGELGVYPDGQDVFLCLFSMSPSPCGDVWRTAVNMRAEAMRFFALVARAE